MADRPNVMIIPGITLEQARKAVMQDRGEVIKAWEAVLSRDPLDAPWDLIDETLALLKEQEAKWVEDKQDEHCRLIKCSKCGLTFIVGNNIQYDEWIEDRNYCRRCGARMVKQQ